MVDLQQAIERRALISEMLMVRVADRLRVLGQPSRLRLIEVLSQGPQTPQQLSDLLGLSQQNVSKHLLVLYRSGVVARQQKGRDVIYTLVDEGAMIMLELTVDHVAAQLQRLADLASQARAPAS